MKIHFISLTLVAFALQVNAQSTEAMKWISGIWKINTGQGHIVEQWRVLNDSTFSGKSYFIKMNNDTIPQESIQLVLRKGQWYYIPTVAHQNNNQPISFKVIMLSKSEFISVNPDHDFPQRIGYRRIKNQLFASIEGIKNGKYEKQNFDFNNEQ